ncbi:MAG: endonuclease/exonuclease/phosphatase family protein [Patescibacteria group bacterium]|jgi:endonuclease/exonuclease/phosphatase family metal-dependent hydrolase
MKLMAYNILHGGQERLGFIMAAIKKESPDFLTINEANNFLDNDGKIIKEFSQEIGLPYYSITSTAVGYTVVFLSKTAINKTTVLMPGKREVLLTEVDSEFGPLSFASLHLSPTTEDVRLPEIQLIINSQKATENRVIMGDMNSLSREDKYGPEIISNFNETQLKKFTNNGQPRFEVIDAVLAANYQDTAVKLGKNKETTVPTPSNIDVAHADLRLDDIFLSESLASHLVDYRVVKNELTAKASDHYPVVAVLE